MTLRTFAFMYAALLMLCLAGVLIGYRYFITIPATKQAIDKFHQRELATLHAALNKEIGFLQTINYDYAVWDESYDFVVEPNQEFIDENLLNDTFTSLKIDGIYYYDLHFNQVFGKGYDYFNHESVGFPELNLNANPQLRSIFPNKDNNKLGVGQNGGFFLTKQGPVMFSSTELRRSDRSGDPRGVLVFIRKVRPGLIQALQAISQLTLSSHVITRTEAVAHIPELSGALQGERFKFKRERTIQDPGGKPVILLKIEHQNYQQAVLFDNTTLFTLAVLSLIPLSMLLFVNYLLVNPVTSTAQVIRTMIKNREFSAIINNYSIKELQDLSDDFNELINVVNQQKAALEQLILTDGLTGIGNRRAFEQFMGDSWSRMQRNTRPVVLLMCDIDCFKPYNDNYGHQVGDLALKKVAQALNDRINRSSDLVARYGGEEFALVLADSNSDNCDKVIDIVLNTVRQLNIPHQYSTVAKHVTISIGAAVITDFSNIPIHCHYEQFIKAADDALYQAKDAGRNCAVKVQFITEQCEAEFCKIIH